MEPRIRRAAHQKTDPTSPFFGGLKPNRWFGGEMGVCKKLPERMAIGTAISTHVQLG